jgi:hypothetical protein
MRPWSTDTRIRPDVHKFASAEQYLTVLGGHMASDSSLLPENVPIVLLNADNEHRHSEVATAATRDHELIRKWAVRHQAEPATGERTASGDATVTVRDGGAGIRFNFPASGRFRPITWEEWFDNFETHELVFVYERDAPGHGLNNRYRLAKFEALKSGPMLL